MTKIQKIGNATVNDGGGLYDSEGIIDQIILKCNESLRMLVSGQYIAFASGMSEIANMLTILKKGIRTELKNRDDSISNLKNMLKNLGVEFIEATDEKLTNQMTAGGEHDGK